MVLEYNKTSQVVLEIVKDLFALNVGDKMKSVRAYVTLFDSSQGTVQNAINYLVETGGIAIDKRGSQGSYLTKFDKNIILGLIGKRHIVGCMPLPYSKRYEGLASGLSGLGNDIMRFHLMYMRGSTNRFSRLLEGSVDYVITSRAAAQQAIKNGEKLEIVKAFGAQSFLSKHILVKSTKFTGAIDENTVLGVDKTSLDQIEIAKLLHKKIKIQLKYINASLIRKYLDNGEIDITIWNFDEILEKHLNYEYLELDFIEGLSKFTETVIVIKSNDHFTRRIIEDEVDVENILQIQKDVIMEIKTPIY
jgi:hypothetical protein